MGRRAIARSRGVEGQLGGTPPPRADDTASANALQAPAQEQPRALSLREDGAALIEYTVLLGILVVAVISLIVAVGRWVNGRWSTLNAQLT
jgi:pilus assembly protein Flp/PilA